MRDADIAEGAGGPGQEDFANGAALLAARLVRQARDLAQGAAALRAAFAPVPGDAAAGPLSDVRRQRAALSARSRACRSSPAASSAAPLAKSSCPGPPTPSEMSASLIERPPA